MAKPLRPFVRGGGYYPSKKWIPLVRNGGYTTQNGGETEPVWATASGAIASFTTPFAYPLKKLLAQINPVQDLHGYDAPYPAGGKGNVYPFQDRTGTAKGVTVVFSGNHIKLIGTGAENGGRTDLRTNNFSLKAGTYYFDQFNKISTGDSLPDIYVQDGINILSPNSAGVFTLSEDSSRINIGANIVMDKTYNYEADIMIVSGSTEPSAFYPYSNLCPISGWTGLSGQRTGVNLFDGVFRKGYYGADGIFYATPSATSNAANTTPISVKGGTHYYYKTENRYSNSIIWYDRNMTVISANTNAQGNTEIVAPDNAAYLNFKSNVSDFDTAEAAINYPSTDTSYHAYTGEPISVSFGRTVYGGSDEVVSGNGTITFGELAFSSLSWTRYSSPTNIPVFYARVEDMAIAQYQQMISSAYKCVGWEALDNRTDMTLCPHPSLNLIYVADSRFETAEAFIASMGSTQFVYPLATPQSFTHEGQSVDTLVGQNNVWVTSGDVEVTYRIE